MDYQKIKGVKHYVFSNADEFKAWHISQGLEVPPINIEWRDAKRGEWVLADDGGVVQLLAQGPMGHHNDRKNFKNNKGWCRTVVGTFPQNKYNKMDTDFSIHADRYRFGASTDANYYQRVKDRTYLSQQETIFVSELCSGKSLQESYESAYGPHADWRYKAILILKRERIMNILSKNIEDAAKKLGIDVEWILGMLKSMAEGTKNDQVRLGVLREIGDWLVGKEKIKQITRGEVRVFEPFGDKELAQITAEKQETITETELAENGEYIEQTT